MTRDQHLAKQVWDAYFLAKRAKKAYQATLDQLHDAQTAAKEAGLSLDDGWGQYTDGTIRGTNLDLPAPKITRARIEEILPPSRGHEEGPEGAD